MKFGSGLLIGLILGWVIDWIIWRHEDGRSGVQSVHTEAEIRRLQAKIDEDQQRLKALAAADNDARLYQQKLQEAEATIEQLRAKLNAITGRTPQKQDRLERISGIGTVFAKRLRAAGINSFAQLADLTPERIKEIVRVKERQKIEPEKWIAQAKEFAHEAGNSQGD